MYAAWLVLAMLAPGQSSPSDWPQLQHNPQRSGYTTESVVPPFRVAWHREFPPERISREVQAVVYAGKVFVGTKSGNLYALGAKDGKEVWKFSAGSPILHTAACEDGKVMVAALDGAIYAVATETGNLAWKFEGDEGYGFSAAPLVAKAMVFIGQRGGAFFALNLKDGTLGWRVDIGAPIFNTAAYDDGKVFFCDEQLLVHCLDAATGKTIWKSDKLYGQSAKQFHPVVCNGLVLLRPMMTHPTREYYNSNFVRDPAKRLDYVFQATWAHYDYWTGKTNRETSPDGQSPLAHWFLKTVPEVQAGRMPKVLMDAQELVVEHYRAKPYDQDLFVLDAHTGKQSFIAPHFATLSLPGPVAPPVADGRGSVIIPWIFTTHCWARLDLQKQRVVEIIIPPRCQNGDNNSNFSVAGNQFFNAHMCGGHHHHGSFDLDTKKFHELPRAPGYWGELSDACESGGNAASIAGGFIYHINYHQLTAWTTAPPTR